VQFKDRLFATIAAYLHLAPDLRHVVAGHHAEPVGQELQPPKQGARHNRGSFRNTNLPNLPLELLHPLHRHRFSHTTAGTARLDGCIVPPG
jgi:hypothetical protein